MKLSNTMIGTRTCCEIAGTPTGGLLLISSPDKHEYTDVSSEQMNSMCMSCTGTNLKRYQRHLLITNFPAARDLCLYWPRLIERKLYFLEDDTAAADSGLPSALFHRTGQ
ncbi:MAG: hypothetical protein ACLSB9_31145 [Hydrogeniiclostridium mannosilyticum]